MSPFIDYPDGHKSLSVKTEDGVVTFINDESAPDYSDSPPCINMGSNITVYLSKPWRLNQVYKIKSNLFCVLSESVILRDIDGDGTKEIWSEWIATAGGSGALRNIIVWDIKQGKLEPKYKYPEELVYNNSQDDNISLSNSSNGEEYKFLSIDSESYYNFVSINEKLYLNHAIYIWNVDEGESHFSDHKWNLARYVLSGDTFARDESWNDGNEYITKSKIGIDDNLNAEISSLFEKIQ